MKEIVIVGAGGFGREVAWLIEDINKKEPTWDILGFVDDYAEVGTVIIDNRKVVGNIEWLNKQKINVVFAIGDPKTKRELCESLQNSGNSYPVLIHPSVLISKNVDIGEGTIITAGNILTVDITIGNHVIINLDCTIGHDVNINNYCTILPSVNVSGNVLLNKCVSVGTGTALIQGITVGENTIIGAGSVVVKDLPENCTAVGSPAKPIKFHNS